MNAGQVLASLSEAEHLALSVLGWLSTSPCLTDREQTAYGELIMTQERQHVTVSDKWARIYGWTPEQGLMPAITLAQRDIMLVSHLPEPMRTIQSLAALRASEEYGVEWLGLVIGQLASIPDLHDICSDYRQVLKDEELHVSVGTTVAKRLGDADPAVRRQEQLAYDRSRIIYGPLIIVWPDLSMFGGA